MGLFFYPGLGKELGEGPGRIFIRFSRKGWGFLGMVVLLFGLTSRSQKCHGVRCMMGALLSAKLMTCRQSYHEPRGHF